MRAFILFLLIFVEILTAKYRILPSVRPKSAIDRLTIHNVADMHNIPQNTSYYAKQIIPVSWSRQLKDAKHYIYRFFEPWQKQSMGESRNALNWQFRFVQRRDIYGFNRRLIAKKRALSWIKNSNFKALNSSKLKGISTKHSNLRAFPTETDIYRNPYKSTEYYPFDYNQNSEIHPNTPLYISHYSLDKKWAFVHAGHTFGWLKVSDFALVNSDFIKQFKSANYVITVKDNMALYRDSKPYSLVKLGTLFPYRNGKILVAVREKDGSAKIVKIAKPNSALVANFPVKFNTKNVAYISKQFYNEPYGWGGKAFCRDCSATTRDFFAPFGIYLDRNSAKQAKEGKYVINIKGLAKDAKKRRILKYAKPFRSLLYVPGHITIYLGRYKNEPVVMHTYWGIRLKNWSKYTLSRTIITTTEPGKEHPEIRERSKLINSLQKIINF